jgi:hypothetical protein
MNVNVEEPGNKESIAEIHERRVCRRRVRRARGNFSDKPVFDDEQWIRDLLDGSVKTPRGDYGFHEA